MNTANGNTVTSSDVNAYLQKLTGAEFTAKDYRTRAWRALALRSAARVAA